MPWFSVTTGNYCKLPLLVHVVRSSLLNMHALSCPKGGFPSIRHTEIRDLTANLLTEVCNDVCIEPELLPIDGEVFTGASSYSQDGARLDITANGFWGG